MSNTRRHAILLGGIGGDSHSVGLTIMRQALTMEGYRVKYLGTQNRLEDFSEYAPLCNVVMISCMDGHAHYYLRRFSDVRRQFQLGGPLWYLGGNLLIGDGIGGERQFYEMGFDRVFVKFVDIALVLEILRRDLDNIDPVTDCPTLWRRSNHNAPLQCRSDSEVILDKQTFLIARREVLEQWKTGHRARDLQENAKFLKDQPSFAHTQMGVKLEGQPILIQPRSGVALLNEQIKLFSEFKRIGVRVLSYQVDSLTRNNNYRGADEAIHESRSSGVSTINGFPVINHGVPGLRKVIREVNLPMQTRHSTRDPRLLAEISYAGGVTSFEGGAICYNIPYYRDYPLSESIKTWQYVDRLTGLYYSEYGIRLDREFFGTLTATLIPPCLAIAVNLIEMVLAIRQGVKSFSLGYAEQGHRIQDIAAIRMLGCMARELLNNLGYKDIQVNTVFHQYMAAFPSDHHRAAALIYNSAITAALSGATRIIVKTPVEAVRIPTLVDNIEGISLVQRGVAAAVASISDERRIAEECSIIRQEVEALLEHAVYSGDGDLARGVVSSFMKGYLDIPFSPSVYNRGEAITARDAEGAVRFLSFGQLRFSSELRQFHREKVQERCRAEGLLAEKHGYLLIEKDILSLARNQYQSWPLHL